MRVTLNVNNPDVDEQDLRLITLDVYPEMTLETLRGAIEAEGIPVPSQHLYHNGQLITDNSQTLQALQISDGDMLALHVRDMRGSSNPAQQQQQQQQQQSQQRRADPGASGGGGAGAGSMVQDPEMIRLQILGDPQLRARVQSMNAPLAAALNDPQRFAQALRETAGQEETQRRQRMQEIEALNADEFNPDSQARIAEMIRQENVMENLQNAMDHNPELLGRVHMLYLNVKVNGVEVKALVDSGAQATIMSPDCAERCNIMHLVDKRFAGIARGVGTAKIIGRVHYTMLQVGTKHLPAAFTVMEGKQVDLLLGLDILKGHQAILDLSQNKLIIQGEGIDFLGESEIPRETEEAINEEPTVSGPGGTTIGGRSGAVTGPAASGVSGPATSAAPPQVRQPAPVAASQPPAPPAQQPQGQQQFPESDIQTLITLGANRQTAIQALEAAEGNVEVAAGLLLDA